MAQAIENPVGVCPLCGEDILLDILDSRVPARWRDALKYRSVWPEIAAEFRARGSIEKAARQVNISSEMAAHLLDFLCIEICGCRTVTCTSCLDDYRSEL